MEVNLNQKNQTETEHSSLISSLRVKFLSLIQFCTVVLTVEKKKRLLLAVSITIWRLIRRKKIQSETENAMGDKTAKLIFLSPIEYSVSD